MAVSLYVATGVIDWVSPHCVNWVGAGDPSSPSKPPAKSRWLKLRTTVQLGGAITQSHKKPPLKREDSFLKRFSTRQSAEPTTQSAHRSFIASQRVLNPDENALFMWLSVLTACVLHNAWTLIVRQAFPELQHAVPRLWFGLDLTTDVVFLADIGVQFRTGYLEQGLMVCDSAKLARHYIRSQRFALDLLALTPLDLVQLWTGPLPIVRIPRFLKLYRAVRFYYMAESRTIYPNMWRVVNLVHILLLLAHWFGCFYYMISELEGFCGSWSYPNPRSDLHYTMLARKYLGSVYWSTLTLTTIGDLATPSTNLQ
ncbi:hypothetical protein LAZ67_14000447 [Cordylochernes scorpioides]|uniref:Ion transport domain-containing protein n=1 Tax=Cordylochernes scorpioides TaxID=51811 RepID=A0ABY6L637_9ARAC|nr:hypothetical protein LAZ67_14000447 [Cordylochernes scorpioides]